MTSIPIPAKRPYSVFLGAGLLTQTAALLQPLLHDAEKLALITDENVELLYADCLEQCLGDCGFQICRHVVPHGESGKTGENYLRILEFLAQEGLTRADAVLALGGGVVGDLAGFAAATYQRGIRYVQIPTTLMAMVDSSVGGKCAIDLPTGKNLAGAFWQPCAVIADMDCLQTLPQKQFSDGCAEILKYAILKDHELFELLARNGRGIDRESVIARCISAKSRIVAADERDSGIRTTLNLGHTVAHAIEKQSRYSVSHGSAVGMGIAVMARAAAAAGDCSEIRALTILDVLKKLGLESTAPFSLQELMPWIRADKKRRGETITITVIRSVGLCELRRVTIADLEQYLKAGL